MKEVRFSCEAATENAVIYCIENGIKFNTIGRCAMMVEESRAKEVAETEETAAAYEETHAARCLHIYLNNESEIYNRYTVPAIRATVANNMQINNADTITLIKGAIREAASLVHLHDHLTPTAADVEFVTRNYVAYIIECAQYENANA